MQQVSALILTTLGKQWKEVEITLFVNLSSENLKAFELFVKFAKYSIRAIF